VAEAPPPEPEPEPEVAEAPPPEAEPEVAEAPPPEAEPEVAEAPPPEPEPEPEVAEAPQPEPRPEPEVAEAPQPTEPEPEPEAAPEPEAPAASETREAEAPAPEAPAPEESKFRFDLDNMIARLVQPGGRAAGGAGYRADPGLVLAVQRHLARIGLDPGPLDGHVGARTMRAVEAYQRARGLPVDGRSTRDLLARLEREPAAPASPGQVPSAQVPSTQILLGGEAAGDGTGERTSQAPPASKFPASSGPVADGYDAFKKGYAAALAGDFDLAIAFYTRAIEGGDLALTHLADAFYNRANARSYKGALEFAIADYGSAIVNKPEFPGAYYNRGFALEATGQHTRALADSMRARALGLRRLGVRSPDVPPPRP
jgi:peptidoglycan hydrolase-like protein with peptidoglycan-binding domain